MRVLMLLMCAALVVGCGEDPEPTEPDVRDDYLVQLTCDKDLPERSNGGILYNTSTFSFATFAGKPVIGGQAISDPIKIKGDFYYKTKDGWSICPSEQKEWQFYSPFLKQDTYMNCRHNSDKAVLSVVFVPAAFNSPDEVSPDLGCAPTVLSDSPVDRIFGKLTCGTTAPAAENAIYRDRSKNDQRPYSSYFVETFKSNGLPVAVESIESARPVYLEEGVWKDCAPNNGTGIFYDYMKQLPVEMWCVYSDPDAKPEVLMLDVGFDIERMSQSLGCTPTVEAPK